MLSLPHSTIDDLFTAFSTEPRPTSIDACPCCLDSNEICRLVSTPLRQISPEDLGSYASSVFLTVGGEADFRYFLPRVLEILATTSGWWPDPEVVGRALATISWERFTSDEQHALSSYFEAVFAALTTAPQPDGCELDSWICCASHIYPRWRVALDLVAAHRDALIALFEWHGDALRRGQLENGFWDDSPKREAFYEWMLSAEVQLALPPQHRV